MTICIVKIIIMFKCMYEKLLKIEKCDFNKKIIGFSRKNYDNFID